ncbi:bacterial translation initiation factor 2 (bIF-2) [Desulfobotulus alkaliphilus]|uniref:Translation initiation factor IF-2 n=1 Tax=Desulfobotulus alkaliphilus TaxID=622671 RepID=A0A562RAW5_9BACT|nr:translation initiation factor IF-2 [Desulfobotulus alkaliphilus]TWI66043.1 bacterial translation initiation factor 2 (bIF-2) [Desulfobotulus alkaliphilus]
MGRMRVYELAKELNMTNKALLDKIAKMDAVEVRSHMSALEDGEIETIKRFVMGKDKEEEENQRVQPSVVRRRKRRSGRSGSSGTQQPESLSSTGNAEKAPDAPADPQEKEAVQAEAQTREERPAASQEKPENTAKPAAKPPKKNKRGTSAKVLFRPEASQPEPAAEEKTEIAEETVPQQEAPAPSLPDVSEKPSETPDIPVKEALPETEDTAISQTEISKAPESAPKTAEGAKAGEGAAEKEEAEAAQSARKKKKNTAAKIIKRIDPAVLAQMKSDRNPSKPAARPAPVEKPAEPDPLELLIANETPAQETAPSSGSRKKKGKDSLSKDLAESRIEDGERKSRKKGRKKSVVEGDALYNRGKKGKRGKKQEQHQKTQITVPKAIKRRIKVDDTIVLAELAKRMGIKASLMIQKLMMMDVMATVNQTIDYDTAVIVAGEFGFEVEKASFEEENILQAHEDRPEEMITRAPVVTVMGHVDHGKTSLLDTIRKTRVVTGEAGGITQHIGAYSVETDGGRITFLDTPGHEAFTAMRSRGAKVTDIVILVVAADDGVMPQTVEAINHAKAAEVPIIVAVNKMDKPGADPDRVKRELSEKGVVAEDWGGDTIFTHVSAKANTGIDTLLEMVLLQAEVLDLKANPDKKALGHVVEAKLDTGRGPVATVLIQEGTLKTGDAVVCGIHHGKIRAMVNDKGTQIGEAGPSIPVEILGLSGVPGAGDELFALKDEKDAKQVSTHRSQKQRAKELARTSRMSLEKLFEQMEEGEVKELNLILKADVQGSIEAIRDSLEKMSSPEVKIHIIHAATGTVTESDISLAAVSNAIILGFNVRPGAKVHDMAREENVDMRFYDIIYNALKDIQDAMVGMMASTFEEKVLGRAEVRQTFFIPKIGTIAGCFITDGTVFRNQKVRLLRDGVIMYDGKMSSLKRFKDDAKEVAKGYECGIGIENYNDLKTGDIIESYEIIEIKPSLKE